MIGTITSGTTIAALGVTAAISIAAVIALIALLTARELASARNSSLPLRIAKFASVGIVPLLLAFAVIVIVRILEIL